MLEDVGLLEVVARQRADAVRAEELGLVEHARQDAPQLALVDDGQHAPVGHAGQAGQVHVGDQLRMAPAEEHGAFTKTRQLLEDVVFEHRHCRQRQQPDDGAHLQARGAEPSGRRSTS